MPTAQEAAQAEVALKYDPQQANLQRQLDSLKAQTAANETGINAYGVTGRQNIGDVYNTLNSLLTANRAQSAGEQATSGQQIGQIYDFGDQQRNALANAARDRMAAMARASGAGPGGELEVLQPFETENLRLAGYNQTAKANALENQKGWATRWDQLLGNGINMGEQTRAQSLSRFESELLNQLGSNKTAGLEGQNELYGKMGDIMGARQNDLITSFERLQQQEWERSMAQAQLDQDAAKANASLAMQKYGIDAQSADAAASRAAAGQLTAKDLAMMAQQAGQDAEKKREFDAEFGIKQADYNQGLLAYQDEKNTARYAAGQDLLGKYIAANPSNTKGASELAFNLYNQGMPTYAGEAQMRSLQSVLSNAFSHFGDPTYGRTSTPVNANPGGLSGYTKPGFYSGGQSNPLGAFGRLTQGLSSAFRFGS